MAFQQVTGGRLIDPKRDLELCFYSGHMDTSTYFFHRTGQCRDKNKECDSLGGGFKVVSKFARIMTDEERSIYPADKTHIVEFRIVGKRGRKDGDEYLPPLRTPQIQGYSRKESLKIMEEAVLALNTIDKTTYPELFERCQYQQHIVTFWPFASKWQEGEG
ncbi:hypothetical protein GCM10017044_05060 [Kordiimonas sediminis]|uniref:Uncharacterized protein n=1 Tax=Kordiimonas sediminis TaxID=1735581 RepID=A0A919AMA0_9PROT|nr:hypothetical protein [Kordiimonas sediminis]GHF13959.1 hypothetical protein GCM10017044_05060 [Kordiimonas sediminis]